MEVIHEIKAMKNCMWVRVVEVERFYCGSPMDKSKILVDEDKFKAILAAVEKVV